MKRQLIIKIFSIIIIISSSSLRLISIAQANPNYSLSLEYGSRISEVEYYNPSLWSEIISNSSDPLDWFPGTSNQTGALSKNIILETGYNDLDTYSTFYQYFYDWLDISRTKLSQNGYGSSYVRGNYTSYYIVWEYVYQAWYFSDQSLDLGYDFEDNFFVFTHPSDLANIFRDYNNFSATVNNDTTMQSLNISLPTANGDDYLWHYALNGLIIANPMNSYLNALIEALECQNATVQGNSLIFNRKGIHDYIVDVTFNGQGLMDSFSVKTVGGVLIYKITSWYPKNAALITFSLIGVGLAGLLSWSIYQKRKKIRFFKEN